MARNGLNKLDPTVRVDLEQMATNPKSEHFISQEATELDIALYWSDWFLKKMAQPMHLLNFNLFLQHRKI